MDQAIYDFVKTATAIEKGVFLMIAGICFVFLIQVIFYAVVKIWPRVKNQDHSDSQTQDVPQ